MSATAALPYVDAAELRRQVDPERARRLIEQALQDGFDPATDPERANAVAGAGHLLLMPSTLGDRVGVKVASVAPANPERGLPRIQALYLLMDAETLTPRLLIEGSALTALRTPATTAVACDRLAAPDAARLVVFGTGPQAIAHAEAIGRIRELRDVRLVGRDPRRRDAALAALADRGLPAAAGATDDVAEADIVICATSAAEPLFAEELVRDGSCVAAIGSHEPDRRELPAALLARSLVVVEDAATAMREAGDVILAVDEGAVRARDLRGLAPLVRGEVMRANDRPNVFKGTGMSWQDLAVAAGVSAPGDR
ncbi:ornithine cyclodeaminase family protein [Leucobacter allii]|uniref:ornithine cyclodeaminase family protein n=1 Tax=Leucobacter allii TaxID=2932247 RepID=UPI001FD52F9F|nr:ornithine cyclodeaminase family protein [Leucobacter allii]UOR02212.1 ornithine cyclodeaminase family protein [Leucobacter allii]